MKCCTIRYSLYRATKTRNMEDIWTIIGQGSYGYTYESNSGISSSFNVSCYTQHTTHQSPLVSFSCSEPPLWFVYTNHSHKKLRLGAPLPFSSRQSSNDPDPVGDTWESHGHWLDIRLDSCKHRVLILLLTIQ